MADANNTTATAPTREEFDQLKEQLLGASETFKELIKENSALRRQLNGQSADEDKPKEVPALPTETFEVGKKKYQFVLRIFQHAGNHITAVDALSDTELLEHLVAVKSGVIKEVV